MSRLRFFLQAVIISFLLVFPAAAQSIISELNGFRLSQFKSVTYREFGEPDMDGETNEELAYEAFILSEEPPLYMVFQYLRSAPDVIYSIQITGEDAKHETGFRGLKLGASPAEVEKVLGKPIRKINAGEHGTRWEFDKANFSIEINPQNKLSSIRIVDERSEGVEADFDNVPKFAEIAKKLQTGTNTEIADLLAPDMEVYEGEKVTYFTRPYRKEISSDSSGIFAAIRRLAKELSSVDPAKESEFEQNLRISELREPMPVFKFYKLKGVTEIVFRWDGRRWLVWEFGSGKPENNDSTWINLYKPGSLKELTTVRQEELLKNPNVVMKDADGKPFAHFSYNSHRTRTKVKFTGEFRKTPGSTLTLLEIWLTTIGRSKEEAKLFDIEYKFTEDSVDYWLPVQSTLIKYFPEEIKNGDEIMIYVAWVGIKYEKDKPEGLIIVNEFTTLKN